MGILGAIGLDDIFGEIGKTVRQVLPNKEAERDFDVKMAELQDRVEQRINAEVLGQLEVNKAEASNGSVFVAGWRPFIGWVCGAALAYNFLLAPILVAFIPRLRDLDTEGLIALVLTMLGSSGIRSFEKLKGVSSDQVATSPMPPTKSTVTVKDDATLVVNTTDTVPTNEEEDAPWNRN